MTCHEEKLNRRSEGGAALVIVLAFVVLLTGLVLAFFANSLSNRKVAGSSASQTKVELFAQGAADTIISDLKQEIAAGSTANTITTGNVTTTIYTPLAPTNAVPALVGSTGTNGLENLVKRSASGKAFYPAGGNYTAGPSRAASGADNSTTNISQNGRSISPARWNKPLLIPPTGTTNLTPPAAAAFTPPDWILVARDGSNPTTWDANMITSSSNATSVVGRYAYAIYDEGGLLDVNVAGYPQNTPTTQIAIKRVLAYADLTQLGTNALGGNATLTQAQVNNLIGWRNYASAQPTRVSGNYTFPTSATNFCNSVNSNSTGFLTVGNAALNGGESDRMFSSRQQLIQFFTQKLGGGTITANLQNALQYFGTFSRSLNQPSFAPDPARPRIASPGSHLTGNASASWDLTTYQGGNDVGPIPPATTGGDDTVNPAFLAIRATSGFTRNDGTTAVLGEPLVKKRFDLRRLAWLTYAGPSAGRTTSDPDIQQVITTSPDLGIDAGFLAQGTAANILKYFGLTWNSGSWTYSHGAPDGRIGTLADVQALNREPDFFELLKAAINAGSLGKAAASGVNNDDGGYYHHQLDISVDYHIIQIGANIIDQSDADGYPTRISFNSKWFRGVENLPGLYRTTVSWAYQTAPDPSFSTAYIPGAGNQTDTDALIKKAGAITAFLIPNIWNIHDQNDITIRGANLALGTPRPGSGGSSELMFCAITNIPTGLPANSWSITPQPRSAIQISFPLTGNNSLDYNYARLTAGLPYSAWSANNTALTFSDNAGALFREPTMLWKAGQPAGSSLTSSGNAVTDLNDGTSHVGFPLPSAPVIWSASYNGTWYICKTTEMMTWQSSPAGSFYNTNGLMTFQGQYKDFWGNWQVYDEKCWDRQYYLGPGVWIDSAAPLSINPAQNGEFIYTNVGSTNQNDGLANRNMEVVGWDPRSASWSMNQGEAPNLGVFADHVNTSPGTPDACANACVSVSSRPAAAYSGITHNGGFMPASRVGNNAQNIMFYSTASYTGGASNFGNSGMWTQNSPWALAQSPNQQFNADADGVVRRAMGAYVPLSATGSTASMIGLSQATATTFSGGNGTAIATQSQSRPIILNRPFKTVDELGYVFKGRPYKNLDFFTPESGDTALLDVFCVNDNSNPDGLVAGKVNLNTRQKPVLQAILSGANYDMLTANTTLSSNETLNVAKALVARTTGTNSWQGPLANVGELVGRFVGNNVLGVQTSITGANSQTNGLTGKNYYATMLGVPASMWASLTVSITYSGLSADLDSTVFSSHTTYAPYIQRLRQSAIRPLAACGQTRVWNLMIDLVAQTGRFPQSATSLQNFMVEGEKRYWLHVAIDRLTGQVIDRQLEVVTE